MERKALLEKLMIAVIEGSEEEAAQLSKVGLQDGIDPMALLDEGMAPGVREVGRRFDRGECFLPELMMAGEAMKAGLGVVLPRITAAIKAQGEGRRKGKILIGSVEGDIHDIGKNIVGAMLLADGFEVVDLGVDIPVWTFIESLKTQKPTVLAVGSYMSTTLEEQKKTVEAMKKAGVRNQVKYLVGGAACSREWAETIGADGYARDANETVRLCRELSRGGE